MENLFIFESAARAAAFKLVALTLPVAVTSLKIGVTHWRLRKKRAAAECQMVHSLVNAVASGVMDFDPAPGRPPVNVFQFEPEEAEMQLIPSPRSLARSKPWWVDTLLPEEPASRIVRVFQLGPASDPDEKLLRGIPKGLLMSASSLDEQGAPTVPSASVDMAPSPLTAGHTEPEQIKVIVLPVMAEQEPLPSMKPIKRELFGFISLAERIANIPMPPLSSMRSAGSTEPKQTVEWKTLPQYASAQIKGLDHSALPMRGFQREELRACPVKSVRTIALSGFTAPAAAIPQLGVDQARKELPLAGSVAPVPATLAVGEAGVQAEPFFITPPMRLPRCRFTVRQRHAVPLFLVPKRQRLLQRCAEG